MYDACSMIRTQVYIEEQTHKDLVRLAEREKKSMAEVTRDILNGGQRQSQDRPPGRQKVGI